MRPVRVATQLYGPPIPDCCQAEEKPAATAMPEGSGMPTPSAAAAASSLGLAIGPTYSGVDPICGSSWCSIWQDLSYPPYQMRTRSAGRI